MPRVASDEAVICPMPRTCGGSAEGASNETEIACASRGLGRAPSSEAEIAPRLARPRRGRTVVPGRGPSVHLGFPYLKRLRASKLGKEPA